MNILTRLSLAGLITASAVTRADDRSSSSLPRSQPEVQGVSSTALLSFLDALDRIDGLHSVMLVRHGNVILEGWWAPYDARSNHELYSLSKSFTSTAVGFAVAEGRLTIDDEVLKFFPEDAPPEPSNNLKAMRVRDLLTMAAGHQDEASSAADKISAQTFLAHPVPHKPGTHFRYNTPATFMLSAILQKLTGQTVAEYLRPRLYEPLGMAHPVWKTNWQGISLGGYGLSVRTEDIAKFGQLCLQKGQWNGRPLLPAEWVELATSRQVSNGSNPRSDWDQGYGFQFWRCRHKAYRGDGAFGQYCVVLPEQDAVLAITSGVKDMQAVLDVVWDKLLPALAPTHSRPDPAAHNRLATRLTRLKRPTVTGTLMSPVAGKVQNRTFVFATNAQGIAAISLTPQPGGTGWIATIEGNGPTSRLSCGFQEWQRSRGSLGGYTDTPLAACAAWTSDDTLTLQICATETPYHFTWKLRFAGDEVFLEAERNVSFGPTRMAPLIGREPPRVPPGGSSNPAPAHLP